MLSNGGSPVLNSTRVTSALQKAPTSDIVQLSMDAIQSQGIDALFGLSSGSNGATSTSQASLADLLSGSTGASYTSPDSAANALLSSAALSGASPEGQLAYYQSTAQAAQTQGLINAGAFGKQSGSLVDLTG